MTTEQTYESGTPSVTIKTSAQGKAQVDVKVYAAPYAAQIHPMGNAEVIDSGNMESLPGVMDELTTIAADAKKNLEAKIRANGGKVAGDE